MSGFIQGIKGRQVKTFNNKVFRPCTDLSVVNKNGVHPLGLNHLAFFTFPFLSYDTGIDKQNAIRWLKLKKPEWATEEFLSQYVFHHDYKTSRLMLIEKEIHKEFQHLGTRKRKADEQWNLIKDIPFPTPKHTNLK